MIYKLKFKDQKESENYLLEKGILISKNIENKTVLVYADGVDAVVHIGKLIDTKGEIENGKITKMPTYIDGYHIDVLTSVEFDLSDKEIFPENSAHSFLGKEKEYADKLLQINNIEIKE